MDKISCLQNDLRWFGGLYPACHIITATLVVNPFLKEEL